MLATPGSGGYAGAMEEWPACALHPDVQVAVIGEMEKLPDAVEAAVERLWQESRRRFPSLFNGRVLTVETIAPGRIACRWTEYRRVAAQFRDTGMFEALRVRPLAVCGPLLCADGVVLGRREAGAVYLAGYWQVPPAGNVDARAVRDGAADFRAGLLHELHEELGIAPGAVTGIRPLCAVEHPGTHVVDIACRIDTGLDAGAIHAAHGRARDRELDELRIVPLAELQAALAEMAPRLMGVVPASLRAAGLVQ